MNNVTKGTIAVSAAVVLLAGLGATFAFWNDSEVIDGAAITAGDLAIDVATAPVWQISHDGGIEPPSAPEPFDPATGRIVPGDILTYTGSYNVLTQGQNLLATIDLAGGSIAPAVAGDAEDEALATRLLQTLAFTVDGTAVTPGTPLTILGSNTAETTPVEVGVTLTWPFDDPAGTSPSEDNPAKLGSVSIADFTVLLVQIDGNTTVP